MLQSIYLVPSSPLYLPRFQKQYAKRLQPAIEAYDKIMHDIHKNEIDTWIIISSKASILQDCIHLFACETRSGNCEKYYHNDLTFQVTCDVAFIKSLLALAKHNHIPISTKKEKEDTLDIGCMMPLHLFQIYTKKSPQIVCISTSNIAYDSQHMFGQCIYECAMQTEKKYALLLSVEASHCVNMESPYGQTKEGILFDKQCLQALQQQTFTHLYEWSKPSLQKAKQNILSALMMLDGVLYRTNWISQYVHYDSTFGIGHIFYKFEKADEDPYVAAVRLILWNLYNNTSLQKNAFYLPVMPSNCSGLWIRIFYQGSCIYKTGSFSLFHRNWKDNFLYYAKKAFQNLPESLRPQIYKLQLQITIIKDRKPVFFPEDVDPQTQGLIIKKDSRQYEWYPDTNNKITGKQFIEQALSNFHIHIDDFYILESFQLEQHHS